MKTNKFAVGIFLLFLFTIVVAEEKQPRISFDKYDLVLKGIRPGSVTECRFHFRNTGDAALVIEQVKASCGCTVTELSSKNIEPGVEGNLLVTYTAGKRSEMSHKFIYVHTNDPVSEKVTLILKVHVEADLEWEPLAFQLDWPVKPGYSDDFRLTAALDKPLQIHNVYSKYGVVAPKLVENEGSSALLSFTIPADAQFRHTDTIVIESNSRDFPRLSIPVRFRKESKLTINPKKLFLWRRHGAARETWKKIIISRRDGEPLHIESVKPSMSFVTTKIIKNDSTECEVRVVVNENMPMGRYDGYLQFITDVEEVKVSVSCKLIPNEKKGP